MKNILTVFADDQKQRILAMGSGEWIDVYDHHLSPNSFSIIGCLIPVKLANKALETDDWKVDPARLSPGCVKYSTGEVLYFRFGDKGYEPLVIERYYGGIKEETLEILEEFRLFHNLYNDQKNKKYVKISKDGNEHDVIRMEKQRITIRAVELKQFLAIKEMVLGLFFDLRYSCQKSLKELNAEREVKRITGADFAYTCSISELLRNESVIRLLGKKVIPGFDKADSDFWPYNENEDELEEEYPQFIVGVDAKGKNLRTSCDPHSGNYLTTVFFRSEVLARYYNNPSKYSVEDGYLRCGGLWSIAIDNDNPDYVCVYLGDLGRDLPESERPYWQSFNIPPAGKMSSTNFRRSVMAEFADPVRKDLVFKSAFEDFQNAWEKSNGWPLFKPLMQNDEHCLASLRIPATEEQNEFDTQVMYLTKLMVDFINEEEIAKKIAAADGQKGISKLEEYLKTRNTPNYISHIQFLRDLQSLRSTGAAHRKGSNYEKIAARLGINEKDLRLVFDNLLDKTILFLHDLGN